MQIFFVVLNEMMTSIVKSQVITPAMVYAKELPAHSIRILFLEPARVAFSKRARQRLAELRDFWPQGQINLYPYIGRLGARAPSITLKLLLSLTHRSKDEIVLHCRGPEMSVQSAFALKKSKGRVVFDARGASDHESALRLMAQQPMMTEEQAQRASEQGREADRRAAQQATAIVAVTRPLANRLREFAVENEDVPGKVIEVIPCCVPRPLFTSSSRQQMRDRLGLSEEEILCVHISTEARWEAFDQVLRFFRLLSTQGKFRMLFLTTLPPDHILRELSEGDSLRDLIEIRTVPSAEIPHYLSAADVGLLLRRFHETHRYASPIKFAEYLGAGLAVAVSPNIGATSEVITQHRIGVVVPDSDDLSVMSRVAADLVTLVRQERQALRERAIKTCKDFYTWERYLPTISKLYGLN